MRFFPWGALWLLAAWLTPATANADEAVWRLLQGGGQVVLIRHALTTPGVGDPEGMTLSDCTTQRNLSDEGRAHARALGDALRTRAVPVGEVLSSPWCRCIETVKLVLGRDPVVEPALGNVFGRSERADAQVAALRPLVSRRPVEGNTLMFSHGSTILALTGVSPDTSEMVVLTPSGSGRFTVAGRLRTR
ncbi:MAG: histidine phosphatase family protein [Rhizobacter sp.]